MSEQVLDLRAVAAELGFGRDIIAVLNGVKSGLIPQPDAGKRLWLASTIDKLKAPAVAVPTATPSKLAESSTASASQTAAQPTIDSIWASLTPAQQLQFGNSKQAFLAYVKAKMNGQVAGNAALPLPGTTNETKSWEALSESDRRDFGTRKAYEAYSRAQARGAVRISGSR